MRRTGCCPKCGSQRVARVPDNAHRYLANSICITKFATVRRIPVARYVCCACGYVEDWVEEREALEEIGRTFRDRVIRLF